MSEASRQAGLLREATRHVMAGRYLEAARIYERLLAGAHGGDDLDLRMRYAYCAERAGRIDTAIEVYRWLVDEYRRRGEAGAAARLSEHVLGLAAGATRAVERPRPAPEVRVEPLTEAELTEALYAMGTRRHLGAGDVLCRAGDVPQELWLLESGAFEVHIPDFEDHDIVRRPEAGVTLLGEIGYFTLQRRTATLVAAEDSSVIEVSRASIEARCDEDPAFAGAFERLMREKWVEPALARHEVFARINDVDRLKLAHCFRPRRLTPGETLIEAGVTHSCAYLLQQGCLFYMHSEPSVRDDAFEAEDGSIITSVLPGDFVHLGGLVGDYPSPYRIVAASPALVLGLSARDFEPFLARRPWLVATIEEFRERPAHLQLMRPEEFRSWAEGSTLKVLHSGLWR